MFQIHEAVLSGPGMAMTQDLINTHVGLAIKDVEALADLKGGQKTDEVGAEAIAALMKLLNFLVKN